MDSFFNADFSDHALYSAWSKHQTELRAQRLQPHNDFLYEVVKDSILARREELFNDLLMVASTSLTPQGLSIPLWSYCAASYDAPRTSLDAERVRETDELLRRKGYQWFVGLVPKGEEPDVQYDEVGWDSTWRWRLPQPVHDVVRNTDFLQRIALLFGNEEFRVDWSTVSQKYPSAPLKTRVVKVELRLHYYPKGVHPRTRSALRRAEEKYATHVSASSPWLMPYVSKGSVEQETGYASPVPHAPRQDPPALPQRSNGGGIHHYEGSDALQRAARDLLQSFDEAAPCHCGYHHPEEEH